MGSSKIQVPQTTEVNTKEEHCNKTYQHLQLGTRPQLPIVPAGHLTASSHDKPTDINHSYGTSKKPHALPDLNYTSMHDIIYQNGLHLCIC